jgi:hypothetical protein
MCMKMTKLRGCAVCTQLKSLGSVLKYGINTIGNLSDKERGMIFDMEGTG